MNLRATTLAGCAVAQTNRLIDERGSFARLFCTTDLEAVVGSRRIVQINHSCTRAVGSVRGMHFQTGVHAEMKLVRCLKGRVFDVAVDIRRGSPTCGQWHAQELSEENELLFVIPEGCAHGFQVLEPDSELLYLHTAAYRPEAEAGLHPLDPRLAIAWPLPVSELSPRDRGHPFLADGDPRLAP